MKDSVKYTRNKFEENEEDSLYLKIQNENKQANPENKNSLLNDKNPDSSQFKESSNKLLSNYYFDKMIFQIFQHFNFKMHFNIEWYCFRMSECSL